MKQYYVYLYLREDSFLPYYVGKGKDKRWKAPHKCEIPPEERVVFHRGLGEKEALDLEEQLIRIYGIKKEGGILENIMKVSVNNQPHLYEREWEPAGPRTPLKNRNPHMNLTPTGVLRASINSPRTKPCTILGIDFSSISVAAEYFGLDRATIRRYIRTNKNSCPLVYKTSKRISCGGEEYNSIREAARAFNLDKGAIIWRLKSRHYPTWKYLT